jgi:hypothetical protein
MKLVELLARELVDWPEGVVRFCQSLVDDELYGEDEVGDCIFRLYPDSECERFSSNDEYEYVTRAQWQAERDRQKGGEWKRHRGGKCPVPVGTKVSTRHRDGEVVDVHFHTATTGSGPATMNAIWKHTGDGHDIMAYKIISQPQADEVEVKDTTIGTLSLKVEVDTSNATQAIDDLAAKWDQIETPFKWRDEVTELNAYIEKYTRERDALIERLASEGFALIPPVVGVVSGFSGAQQTIPFEEWTDGDIVRCVDTNLSCAALTVGKEYTVVTRHGETGVIDDEGDHMCSCIDVGELEFIRRT